MIELRHLKYFVAVAEHLHFALAAEALGISPPTLTVQIQQLERRLQARLFARTKRAVSLTAAGEAFLAEAQLALRQVERTINVGQLAGRGQLGRIEIGYVGSAAYSGVLQQQLRLFRRAFPQVLVTVREQPMARLPELLKDGQVDIAFVRLPIVLDRSLRSQVVLRDRYCVALPAEHRLASASGPVKSRELATETFIVPEQDSGTKEVSRRGRFALDAPSRPGSLLQVLTEVSFGAGVAIVPDILQGALDMPNVVFKPLAGEPINSEVAAVYRGFERSPVVKNLIEQLLRTSIA
ncbi:LysR family transcriptional regulator [Pollutimonas thiosulfatoxidans]|uniref:LysR family transcriptional regulator n=1 Tax=Pollutimonas thiosulfatoxidans TaxID=2028345 RepID=UPI00269BEC0C